MTLIEVVLLLAGIQWLILLWPDPEATVRIEDTPKAESKLTASVRA